MSCALLVAAAIFMQILTKNVVFTYKDLDEYEKQLRIIQKKDFGVSETLLTKAFKFLNSERDVMGMMADELWNIGEKTIDTIVDVEGM